MNNDSSLLVRATPEGIPTRLEDLKEWAFVRDGTQTFFGKMREGEDVAAIKLVTLCPVYQYLEAIELNPQQGLLYNRSFVPVGAFLGARRVRVRAVFVLQATDLDEKDREVLLVLCRNAEVMRKELRKQASPIQIAQPGAMPARGGRS